MEQGAERDGGAVQREVPYHRVYLRGPRPGQTRALLDGNIELRRLLLRRFTIFEGAAGIGGARRRRNDQWDRC